VHRTDLQSSDLEMHMPKIVSREEWLVARKALLAREKELTHLRDKLSAERRELPWVKVEKPYVFEGASGRQTLTELFDGRSQLLVYHFMMGPDWQQGCPSCSFLADHLDGITVHLENHDVSLVVVARAPWPNIKAFKARMGWRFKWLSSAGSDFNFDFNVSFSEADKARGKGIYNYDTVDTMFDEMPGMSAFAREGDAVYHTYSAYARGADILLGTYNWLDLAPKGRNETIGMEWVRHHDRYGVAMDEHGCCGGVSDPISEFRARLMQQLAEERGPRAR
jgi:predicted dithiol-disulfide oxidoreductase (DUF899 family)